MGQTYMVIERFKPGAAPKIYARVDAQGRLMPEGVRYVGSWIDSSVSQCYQVMEADSRAQLEAWMDQWRDLVDFEVVEVISSAEARARVMGPT